MTRFTRITLTAIATLVALAVTIYGAIDIQLMLFGRGLYEEHTATFATLWAVGFVVGAAIAYCVAYTLTKALSRVSTETRPTGVTSPYHQ